MPWYRVMHDVPLIPLCRFPGTKSGASNQNYSFALSLLTAEDGATVQVRK
jgi:hypothetical protein